MNNLRPWIVAIIVFVGWYALTADWSAEIEPPRPDEEKQEQTEQITPSKIAVLILEETEDRQKPENRKYLETIMSSRIREYLNSKGHKWRVLDKDVDPASLDDFWRSVLQATQEKAQGRYPFISLSNGTRGTAGIVPDSEEESLALLKKWGGE